MIIRDDGDTLLFITQPDHAALAADAIAAWQDDGFPAHPRRDAILLAAREHDNGWIEEDAAAHVSGGGAPLDFVSVPASVKQRIWPRATDRLAARSAYAAALVAQHALTIYGSLRSDAAWAAFFEEMTRRRDGLLARAGAAVEMLDGDYRFVNAADRISLAFCTGWRAPLDTFGGRIILADRNTVTIAPDPFAGARVPLRIRARRLPRRSCASGADLRRALDEAPAVTLDGVAAGSP